MIALKGSNSTRWLQRVLSFMKFHDRATTDFLTPCSGNLMTFHRADFQKALLRRLPSSYKIHCNKRLRSYTQRQGGPISLLFEDGSQSSCDVLLGADGLKSAVRRSFLGEKAQWAQSQNKWPEAADITALIEPSWSGTNAYRALIPADRLRQRSPDHRVFTQPTQVRPSPYVPLG